MRSVDMLLKYNNLIFVGEAGSGKSEIAINIALLLKKETDKEVHYFDMDQTKPLFRSRDVKDVLENAGIIFHYEEQFFDAPTQVGGVEEKLADPNSLVIMDTGGNHTGARLIGGYSALTNRENTKCFFVINPYRPWSQDLESVDGTLSSILKSARINEFGVMSNPNLGAMTTADTVLEGNKKVQDMIGEYVKTDFVCVTEEISEAVSKELNEQVIKIKKFIKNPYD